MYNEIELYNEIGKNIKKRRKSLNITQEKLAELTNYSLSFIANIESRTYQSFSLSALNNIAIALKTSLKDLLPGKLTNIKTNKIKCEYCKFETEIPLELIKLISNIEDITNEKLKLTCPKCHKKTM